MLGIILRGSVQLPDEQWGTELQPFNEQFEISAECETWDVVEGIAQRLGVTTWVKGDRVYFDRGDGNYGDFDNSTQGIRRALQFLGGIQT